MVSRSVSVSFLLSCLCAMVGLVLMAGCSRDQSEGNSTSLRKGTAVPLALSPGTGFLTFTAYLNGQAIHMAVDTAANTTSFDLRLLDRLQLKPKDAGVSKRWAGTTPLKVAYVREFRVGSLSTSFEATFIDLGQPNEGLRALGEPPIDGLLGMDLLLKWRAKVDCDEKTLVMRKK
jgi:hypothetical protein